MIKDRVIQLLEYKKIPKEAFYKKIGMTSASFRGSAKLTPLNSSAIENILSEIPDLNLEWLLTGKGEILQKSNQELIKIAEAPPQDGVIALYKEWLAEKDSMLAEKDRQLAEKAKELIEMGREVGRLEAEVKALKEVLVQRAGGGAPNAGEQGADRAAS